MDHLTQGVTISYPRELFLSIKDNSTHHHPNLKPVFNTLLHLGISRYKPTKRGETAGRKLRQRMTDSTITNGISVFCQSVRTKSTYGIITDMFVEHDIGIFACQEIWLAYDSSDDFCVAEITPSGSPLYLLSAVDLKH